MKALVINTTRMGDLIQSTPLLQGLQAQGYEVTLLYSDGFGGVAKMLAGVDRLIPIDLAKAVAPLIAQGGRFLESYNYLAKILGGLRSDSFDLVLNVTHSAYSSLLTGLIAGEKTAGLTCGRNGESLNRNAWSRYYLTSQICRESNRFNLVDVNRMICGVNSWFPVRLNVPAEAFTRASELLPDILDGREMLIGLVPGASTIEKTLPAETFATAFLHLSRRRPVRALIFGAKSEVAVAGRLAQMIPGSIDLSGKTDVATLAALISKCKVLISNDTGPMHIAAATGTVVIDISLGSALATETAPYGEGHYVIEGRIDCHPCLPRMKCSHRSCGKIIPPEVIADVAEAALSGKPFQVKSDRQLETVKIYRTGFDRDGFLRLISLIDREPVAKEVLFEEMRELWKKSLAGMSKMEMQEGIEARLPGSNSTLFHEQLISLTAGFERLREIATIGAASCREIMKLSQSPDTIETLKALSGAVSTIDREIARLAYARQELMPFAAWFAAAKETIDSTSLHDHARDTAGLFELLEGWCEGLIARLESYRSPGEIVDAA